jgi:hypothetical protein
MLKLHRSKRLGLAIALTTLAVALAGSQSAQAISIPVLIDGITVVEDGVAVLTGATEAEVVEVNGELIRVGEGGTFIAPIDLDEESVVLKVLESPSELVTVEVPVDVLLATGGEGVLNDLLDASISIDEPLGGFQIVDGQLPLIEGRVSNGDNLSVLEVNGVDALSRLGDNGLFSIVLGGSSTTERITVVAADRSGVSQTSTFTARRVTSAIATRAGTSVSAAGAQGIRIVKVALDKRFLKPAKSLGLIVTVKDRRGFLIRGAALQLRALPAKHVANGALKAGFTNRLGKGRFAFRLKASAFTGSPAQFFTIWTRAATPKSSATKKVTLRLPAAVKR